MNKIEIGDLVRPVGDDLRNAFFRVSNLTPNGWAHCYCVAYANGTRTTPDGRSRPKFRTKGLARVTMLPPDPGNVADQPRPANGESL